MMITYITDKDDICTSRQLSMGLLFKDIFTSSKLAKPQFCQVQPIHNCSWAKLAQVLIDPAVVYMMCLLIVCMLADIKISK